MDRSTRRRNRLLFAALWIFAVLLFVGILVWKMFFVTSPAP